MKVFDLVDADRVKILDMTDKDDALKAMCDLLSRAETVTDPDELREAIFDRENIISTSIGLGIAIPHVRLASVTAMTIAIGVLRKGIDYKSFDDHPVNILIMIAAPEGAHREYLSLLAKIALLLKNEKLRETLLSAETSEEIYDALKGH